MIKFGKWLLYGIYTVAIAAFFLYYLFPSETVKKYIVARAGSLNPEIRVSIDDVTPVFSHGLRLHAVQLEYRSRDLLDAEEIVIVPDLLSLLSANPSFAFHIKALGGGVKGDVEITRRQPQGRIKMNAEIAAVRLENTPSVRRFFENRLTGICSGTIIYTGGPGQGRTLNALLSVAEVTVRLNEPVFGMAEIAFDSVAAEVTLRNRQLKISRLMLQGDQFDGEFAGSGVIREDFDDSPINLSGTITPQSKFMQGSGLNISGTAIAGSAGGGGQIPVKISGPLGDIRLSLK